MEHSILVNKPGDNSSATTEDANEALSADSSPEPTPAVAEERDAGRTDSSADPQPTLAEISSPDEAANLMPAPTVDSPDRKAVEKSLSTDLLKNRFENYLDTGKFTPEGSNSHLPPMEIRVQQYAMENWKSIDSDSDRELSRDEIAERFGRDAGLRGTDPGATIDMLKNFSLLDKDESGSLDMGEIFPNIAGNEKRSEEDKSAEEEQSYTVYVPGSATRDDGSTVGGGSSTGDRGRERKDSSDGMFSILKETKILNEEPKQEILENTLFDRIDRLYPSSEGDYANATLKGMTRAILSGDTKALDSMVKNFDGKEKTLEWTKDALNHLFAGSTVEAKTYQEDGFQRLQIKDDRYNSVTFSTDKPPEPGNTKSGDTDKAMSGIAHRLVEQGDSIVTTMARFDRQREIREGNSKVIDSLETELRPKDKAHLQKILDAVRIEGDILFNGTKQDSSVASTIKMVGEAYSSRDSETVENVSEALNELTEGMDFKSQSMMSSEGLILQMKNKDGSHALTVVGKSELSRKSGTVSNSYSYFGIDRGHDSKRSAESREWLRQTLCHSVENRLSQ